MQNFFEPNYSGSRVMAFKGGFDATKSQKTVKCCMFRILFCSAWSLKEVKLSTGYYYARSNLYPAKNIFGSFNFQGVNTSSNLKKKSISVASLRLCIF